MGSELLSQIIITKVNGAQSVYSTFEKKGAHVKDRLDWGIFYKSSGETVYTCRGKQYTSNPNTIIIVPKGCTYDWRLVESGIFSYITFDADLTYDEIFQFPVSRPDACLSLFMRAKRLSAERKSAWQVACLAEIYALLSALLTAEARAYSPRNRQGRLQPALDYLAAHYAETITNDMLASATGYSTSHFRRIFCETFHVSPMAYLQSLRISKAKELLQSGIGTITGIALSVGYANIYDFSRAFKKETGVSPSKYAHSGVG